MLPKLTLPQTVREDARSVQTAAMVLEAALDMHRDGTLDHLLVDRPGAARWLTRIFLQPILGVAGDALPPDRALTTALTWLMEWAITQLRPDRAPTLQIDDRKAWLDSTSWRPMIAVMCHYDFAPVPDFKDRYYRRLDETPADNLCGLWNVGPSTYYRYLEKAKRLMARALYEQRLDNRHAPSLRRYAQQRVYMTLGLSDDALRYRWHRTQLTRSLNSMDYLSALWHADKSDDIAALRNIVQKQISSLAQHNEFREFLDIFTHQSSSLQDRFFFLIQQSELYRLLSQSGKELAALEEALRIAADESDEFLLGVIYSSLGKFHEPRDVYRALTYYQEGLSFLGQQSTSEHEQDIFSLSDMFIETTAKLAWIYVLRNDPRAEAILSEQRVGIHLKGATDTTLAMLEQVWGEFFRRNGNLEKALEHRNKAYVIYERLNNRDGIAKSLLNLGLVYIDMGLFEKSLECFQKALESAGSQTSHTEFLASAHLNMGVCYYWQKHMDMAETEYRIVLDISAAASLKIWQARAHQNLAEVHYQRFIRSGSLIEEKTGDEHVNSAASLYSELGIYNYVDIVKRLKEEMLTNRSTANTADRLVPQELAANYPEISEVDMLRKNLQTLDNAEDIARAQLRIAEIYLRLSIKEREEARSLASQYHFTAQVQSELDYLTKLFHQDALQNRFVAMTWKEQAGELLDDKRRASIIEFLMTNGFINKSRLAALCDVSLATASKYLAVLAEKGLLVQEGKGPATKYRLKTEKTPA